jgi:hypothetical protein
MKDDARRDPAFSLSVDLLPPGGISVGNRARLTASPTDSMSRTPKSIVITSLLTLEATAQGLHLPTYQTGTYSWPRTWHCGSPH